MHWYPHTNDHWQHVALQTQLLSLLLHTERHICKQMCTRTFTHRHTDMHKYSSRYIPRDSLHLCQLSILPALTSSVSYTLRSMQTSFESIYPSVLALSRSLSPCLTLPVHLLYSSPNSLPRSLPVVVTYLVKIHVSRFRCAYSALTFSAFWPD